MSFYHGGDWYPHYYRHGILPLDFSASIAPIGIPKHLLDAMERALSTADRYPDPKNRALISAISGREKIPASYYVCGSGASGLLDRILRVLSPKRVLVAAPAFEEYRRLAELNHAEVVSVYLNEASDYMAGEELIEAVDDTIGLLIIGNPNNPTGQLLSADFLDRLFSRCVQTGTRLLADECFLRFCEDFESFSMRRYLKNADRSSAYKHLIVLDAFTKFYAIPGIRLGYMISTDAALVRAVASCGSPWDVSVVAQAAGIAAFADPDYEQRVRRCIEEQKQILIESLASFGFHVIPGKANFLMFYIGDQRIRSRLHLLDECDHILIRDCSNFTGCADGWYRVCVRTKEENRKLCQAFEKIIQQ